MKCRRIRPLALTLSATACIAILSGVALAQQQAPTPPPTHLIRADRRDAPVNVSYPDVSASVNLDLMDREVHFLWRRTFQTGESTLAVQVEKLSFWPTEAVGLWGNPDHVVVAGVNTKGKTIIQLWYMDASIPLPAEQWDASLHEWVYPETFIPVGQKWTVYRGSQSGMKRVRTMFPNLGNVDEVFVQFDDSGDLYSLNVTTGARTLVLSAGQSPGEQQPALNQTFYDRDYGDHLDLGYIYLFERVVSSGTDSVFLMLQDADRDGVLDPGSSTVLGASDWASLALGDPAKYQYP